MKIIAVDNCFAATPQQAPVFSGISDTAFLNKNKPFFIPDFANPCIAQPYFVVQICRLGRSISERFARRYYNKMTTGVIFTAQNLWNEALAHQLPCDYARSFDGAAAIGKMIDLADDFVAGTLQVRTHHQQTFEGNTAKMCFTIDQIIAYISRYQLLRQGDLVFLGSPSPPFQVHINDHLDGCFNGEQVFSFNIK